MATHGKNATLYMGSMVLTDYFRNVATPASVDVAEASTFGDDDKTYVPGLGDATMSGEGIYDTSGVGAERDLAAALGATSRQIISVYHGGDTLGNAGVGMSADATALEVTAEISDIVMISAEAQSSTGYERLLSVHANAEETAAGTTASVNAGADSTNGGAGYLHVSAISGSMAFVIEHSDDDISYSTLVNFGTVIAPIGTRVAFTGTAEQYARLVHTPATTGTATFVCGLARQD